MIARRNPPAENELASLFQAYMCLAFLDKHDRLQDPRGEGNSEQGTLASLVDSLNNNGYCNLTVCPVCRVDDFTHVEDCLLAKDLQRYSSFLAWNSAPVNSDGTRLLSGTQAAAVNGGWSPSVIDTAVDRFRESLVLMNRAPLGSMDRGNHAFDFGTSSGVGFSILIQIMPSSMVNSVLDAIRQAFSLMTPEATEQLSDLIKKHQQTVSWVRYGICEDTFPSSTRTVRCSCGWAHSSDTLDDMQADRLFAQHFKAVADQIPLTRSETPKAVVQ